MGEKAEGPGDVLTGNTLASAAEGKAGIPAKSAARGACRNCGAILLGRYCSACGQPAHIHRDLVSLGHDILHGVFHFEGKIWRTVPELFFHPGRLTRRYIDGERAKFVSPVALLLFTVFLMFAVFSITGGVLVNRGGRVGGDSETKAANAEAQRSKTVGRMSFRTWAASDPKVELGWPALDRKLTEGLKQLNENPKLLLYKLKSNAYKFSWALIPMSLPFLWLMFFWRRDIHIYDHAIFVTYSISFVMLFLIVLSIGAAAGARRDIWETAIAVVLPIHLYRQLRGAYGVSRFGALVRLFLLLISISIVLVVFSTGLLLIGVLD